MTKLKDCMRLTKATLANNLGKIAEIRRKNKITK